MCDIYIYIYIYIGSIVCIWSRARISFWPAALLDKHFEFCCICSFALYQYMTPAQVRIVCVMKCNEFSKGE